MKNAPKAAMIVMKINASNVLRALKQLRESVRKSVAKRENTKMITNVILVVMIVKAVPVPTSVTLAKVILVCKMESVWNNARKDSVISVFVSQPAQKSSGRS